MAIVSKKNSGGSPRNKTRCDVAKDSLSSIHLLRRLICCIRLRTPQKSVCKICDHTAESYPLHAKPKEAPAHGYGWVVTIEPR